MSRSIASRALIAVCLAALVALPVARLRADEAAERRLAELIREGLARGEAPMSLLFNGLAQLPDMSLDAAAIRRVLAATGFDDGPAVAALAPFTRLEKRGDRIRFRSNGRMLEVPGEGGAVAGRVRFGDEGDFRLRRRGDRVQIDKISGIEVGSGPDGGLYSLKDLELSPLPSGETRVELTAGWGIFNSTREFRIPAPPPPPPPAVVNAAPPARGASAGLLDSLAEVSGGAPPPRAGSSSGAAPAPQTTTAPTQVPIPRPRPALPEPTGDAVLPVPERAPAASSPPTTDTGGGGLEQMLKELKTPRAPKTSG